MGPEKEVVKQGWREIRGILLLVVGLVLFLSMLFYDANDIAALQQPPNSPPNNLFGILGAWSAFVCFVLFGVASYLVPILVVAAGLLHVFRYSGHIGIRCVWMVALLMSLCCMATQMEGVFEGTTARLNIEGIPGGLLGEYVGSAFLVKLLGQVGSMILLALLALASIVVLMEVHPVALWGHLRNAVGEGGTRLAERMQSFKGEELEELDAELLESQDRLAQAAREGVEVPKPKRQKRVARSKPERAELEPVRPAPPVEPEKEPPKPKIKKTVLPKARKKPAEGEGEVLGKSASDQLPVPTPSMGEWSLPSITLLDAPDPNAVKKPKFPADEAAIKLMETLAEFGVDAEVTHYEEGPTVTSFEVKPAAGVRVEKISGLSNNIALKLEAESIRVQAPIPGKPVVGIEVPNGSGTMVYVRSIMQSKAYRSDKVALPLVLGMDVSGREIVADMADMPHLLIAGATGSGKSVCMNTLLAGLLMSRSPEQVRLMLVDPKIVEFTAFKNLPHLVVPVITDPKKVSLGLRWAINEMERRYKLFAKVGVRNIKAFNGRKKDDQPDLFEQGDGETPEEKVPETVPYIVIVIDELADLMMVAQADVENAIARLAQLSRAVGIHMVIATQRPSVNVITGTIKANFPARIAFQVAQKVDSRTILDANGADKLLGKGDMLFLPPGTAKIIRAQGAMTTDDEINLIVAHWREQGKPVYETAITEKIESTAPLLPGDTMDDEEDELLEAAKEVIRQTKRASTSSLQRRLRIGYNRAARLMDQLEEKGVIGPPQGSDPREILIDLDGEIPQNPGVAAGAEAEEADEDLQPEELED